MSETTVTEQLEMAGLKLYPIAEVATIREKVSQLSEVLDRIMMLAVKDTRHKDKSDLVGILCTIHSEAFVALKESK